MKVNVVLKFLLFLTSFCSLISCLSISHKLQTVSMLKNPEFTTTIRQIPKIKQSLYQSAIIFVDDVLNIDEIRTNLVLGNNYAKHLIFIIVFMNGNIENLELWRLKHLTYKSSTIELYSYFLVPGNGTYKLMNLNWFTEFSCNQVQMAPMNSFSKLDGKWQTELKYQRRFMKFRNCMITLSAYFEDISGVHLYYGSVTGLVPEVFRIMSDHGNFTPNFQIYYRPDVPDRSSGKIIYINLYMRLGIYSMFNFGQTHFGSEFISSEYLFYVTPGELYTSYEKLYLPFDDTTWLFILITFSVAFVVIFLVNFLPKWAQSIFYGLNVHTPALNVVQTFFGISQTQLPVENSARMILIFFIFFCLVIRTAYQGVSFEFLTTEMRKKPIDSIEKLITQNFTIVTVEGAGHIFSELIYSMIGKEAQKKRIVFIPDKEIVDFYRNNVKNASAKLAIFLEDTFFDSVHFSTNGIHGIRLKEKLFSHPMGLGTFKNHFMSALIEDTMQMIIPTGIPQYLFGYHRWLQFFKFHADIKTGPNVLSIDDLSFGFVLWAVACGISAIVFCAEVCGRWLKHLIKKCLGLVILVYVLINGYLRSH